MSNTENLLEGMEGIFHKGPTDISDQVLILVARLLLAGNNPT